MRKISPEQQQLLNTIPEKPEDPAELPVLNKRQFGEKPTTFYHGSVREYNVGDVIKSGFSGMDNEYPTNHHVDPADALADARALNGLSHMPDVKITAPTVYSTEAIGTAYPERGGKQWKTSKGFRVTGIVHQDPKEYTDAVQKRAEHLNKMFPSSNGYSSDGADRG